MILLNTYYMAGWAERKIRFTFMKSSRVNNNKVKIVLLYGKIRIND